MPSVEMFNEPPELSSTKMPAPTLITIGLEALAKSLGRLRKYQGFVRVPNYIRK